MPGPEAVLQRLTHGERASGTETPGGAVTLNIRGEKDGKRNGIPARHPVSNSAYYCIKLLAAKGQGSGSDCSQVCVNIVLHR